MRIAELENAPEWLKQASTIEADVELLYGIVVWRGGTWHGGIWRGGEWHGGEWRGGEWHGQEDRLLYMATLCGIVFVNNRAVGYRTTSQDGQGRHVKEFVQPEGKYSETDLPPSGSGTCVKGIHITTAARAWTYFGVDPTCQMWEVTFSREQLLDCDGEKARMDVRRQAPFPRSCPP